MAQSAIILDVDGVLNSFQNRKFYAKFILEVGRSLKHLNPNRKNIMSSIQDFKKNKPNPNGLFRYLRGLCKNDAAFNKLAESISNNLNFKHIPKDDQITKCLEEIAQSDNRIVIRTDGLKEVAEGVLKSLTGGKFNSQNVTISDIRDNNFMDKTMEKSWPAFFKKHDINPVGSVLLDDSKQNIDVAAAFGVEGNRVCSKDPLQKFMHKIVADRVRNKLNKKQHANEVAPVVVKTSGNIPAAYIQGYREI